MKNIRQSKAMSHAPLGWRRRLAPVVVLFFLAPLIGEFLLGNQKVANLTLLPLLALLYGGGAILIREVTRRLGRGYPTMLGLGLAYALFEEGIVDQLFFNVHYFAGQGELSVTTIPFMGIDAWLTLVLLAMHAIWSTCIPIVIVESIFGDRGPRPWLSASGLGVVGVLFLIGSVILGLMIYYENRFFAPWPQLAIMSAVLVGIIFVTLRKRPRWSLSPLAPPKAWIAGATALIFSSLYMFTQGLPGWTRVLACLALAGVFFVVLYRWSRVDWSARHTLAVATGGILTYAWLGAFMTPESGPKTTVDHIGTAIFIVLVLGLVRVAAKRIAGRPRTPKNTLIS